MRENVKMLNTPKKSNLARNLKHMTIDFDSNHYTTIIYSKQCWVPRFVPSKPSLNHFMRESAKKHKKKPLKSNYALNLKQMNIVFDSNAFNTIIYTKECAVQSFVPNKPSLNHFIRECAKTLKKP